MSVLLRTFPPPSVVIMLVAALQLYFAIPCLGTLQLPAASALLARELRAQTGAIRERGEQALEEATGVDASLPAGGAADRPLLAPDHRDHHAEVSSKPVPLLKLTKRFSSEEDEPPHCILLVGTCHTMGNQQLVEKISTSIAEAVEDHLTYRREQEPRLAEPDDSGDRQRPRLKMWFENLCKPGLLSRVLKAPRTMDERLRAQLRTDLTEFCDLSPDDGELDTNRIRFRVIFGLVLFMAYQLCDAIRVIILVGFSRHPKEVFVGSAGVLGLCVALQTTSTLIWQLVTPEEDGLSEGLQLCGGVVSQGTSVMVTGVFWLGLYLVLLKGLCGLELKRNGVDGDDGVGGWSLQSKYHDKDYEAILEEWRKMWRERDVENASPELNLFESPVMSIGFDARTSRRNALWIEKMMANVSASDASACGVQVVVCGLAHLAGEKSVPRLLVDEWVCEPLTLGTGGPSNVQRQSARRVEVDGVSPEQASNSGAEDNHAGNVENMRIEKK